MFSFVHLSDLHLPPSETDTRHGVYPCRKLEDVVNSIDELEYTPSFAIITGDLAQGGTVQGYELVKRYAERLEEKGIRTMLAMGNGDDRENYRRVFQTPSSREPIHYSEDHEYLRVIVLDSLRPGSHGGRLEGEQLEWLADVLKGDSERPAIIALHHPINTSSLALFDGWLFDGSQRDHFYEAISGGNVLAVLNGHLHHNQVTTVNGVPHVQAGSTLAELNYNEEEYWIKNASSYNQVIYRDGMPFVKTITLPYDGRVLLRKPLRDLFGR